MKIRMNVIAMTPLVILAVLIWIVAKQRNAGKPIAAAPTPTHISESLAIPKLQVIHTAAPIAVVRHHATDEPARIGDDDSARHIAQPGETVSSLATDLLGEDTRSNRDAIVNANSSLKADPDKLVAGKSYRIPPAPQVCPSTAVPVVQAPRDPNPPAQRFAPASPRTAELKYTATSGDTVAKMAQAFLGSDQKVNLDAIINANPSLQADPDRIVIGRTYTIPVPDGLSTTAASIAPVPRPATQPDADQVVAAGSTRTLRYTARTGDSVTTLAIKLLGSDTQEARDLIISNNPELKRDPDRVVAGQSYWIPAPVAATRNP